VDFCYRSLSWYSSVGDVLVKDFSQVFLFCGVSHFLSFFSFTNTNLQHFYCFVLMVNYCCVIISSCHNHMHCWKYLCFQMKMWPSKIQHHCISPNRIVLNPFPIWLMINLMRFIEVSVFLALRNYAALVFHAVLCLIDSKRIIFKGVVLYHCMCATDVICSNFFIFS